MLSAEDSIAMRIDPMPAGNDTPIGRSPRFHAALIYAATMHAEQKRKGTEIPYLAHVLAVASLVLEAGGDEDTVIGALLHDVAEDQGGHAALEEIRRTFGERVAGIVDGCTDAYSVPKPPWRARKERYVAHLRDPATPAVVAMVSCADKLHNARSILADYRRLGERLWERFTADGSATLWYYEAVVAALQQRGDTPMVDELALVVAELRRLMATGG
jgi:GTP pyrophosphokinase